MSAKLDQLLAYFDREGVTEILVGVGRPLTVRSGAAQQSLTVTPLTRVQLESLLTGTPLEGFLGKQVAGPAREFEIGKRRVKIEVVQRGDETMFKLEPVKLAVPTVSEPMVRITSKMARLSPDPPERVEPKPEQFAASLGDVAPDDDAILDERADVSGIAPFVRAARQRAASDVHISAGQVVQIRVLGSLVPLDPAASPLSPADAKQALLPLLGAARRKRLEETGYVDLSLDVPGAGRLRGNVSRQRNGLHGAFRLAPASPRTLEELGLPRELAKVVSHHQGLVVVAGPSGHGKTTTLAALVDIVNSSRPHHIITIEDPVEILHPRKAAIVSQREVGAHTRSFVSALKASLREDPDVIVIGELRDRETVEIALTAAETGHLVLATMSTPSAAKTIDRLIDMFPPDNQSQVRSSIGSALRAIIAQRLLPAASGEGMVAAIELVTGVLPLAVLIRDDKLHQLPSLMQRGRAYGMIRLDESLVELHRTGKISDETMRMHVDRKELATSTQVLPTMPEDPAPPAKRGFFGRKDRP